MNTNAADYSFRYTDLVEIKTEKRTRKRGTKKESVRNITFWQ